MRMFIGSTYMQEMLERKSSEGIRWKQQAQEITETLWYGILWYDSFITQLLPFRMIYRL